MVDFDVYETQDVEKGGFATKPADPYKQGHDFLGWFDENDDYWIFEVHRVDRDIVLFAAFLANEVSSEPPMVSSQEESFEPYSEPVYTSAEESESYSEPVYTSAEESGPYSEPAYSTAAAESSFASGLDLGVDLSAGGDLNCWCPIDEMGFTEKHIDAFKARHPEFHGQINVLAADDGHSCLANLREDFEAAADVFPLFDNNLVEVDPAGYFQDWNASDLLQIKDAVGEKAIEDTRIMGKTYGLPYRNDNSYVLIYDRDIVSDEDAKTVEGILAACKKNGATFNFDVANSWYTFSPIWGAGGKNYTDENGIYHSEIATEPIAQALADFNNILAAAGDTFSPTSYYDHFGSDDTPVGATISWNCESEVISLIGEQRTGCAVLPTFTSQGKQIPMKAFQGYQTWVMKKGLDEATRLTARAFCLYMVSDVVAAGRIRDLGHGVPNPNVQAQTELWTSEWIRATSQMHALGRTVSQMSGGVASFWNPATAIGASIANGDLYNAELALDALYTCQTSHLQQ